MGTRYFPQQDIHTAIAAYLSRSVGLPSVHTSGPILPGQRSRWIQSSVKLASKVSWALVSARISASEAKIMAQLAAAEARGSKIRADARLWISVSLSIGVLSLAFAVLNCLVRHSRERSIRRVKKAVARRLVHERNNCQRNTQAADLRSLANGMHSAWRRAERAGLRTARPYVSLPLGHPDGLPADWLMGVARPSNRGQADERSRSPTPQ